MRCPYDLQGWQVVLVSQVGPLNVPVQVWSGANLRHCTARRRGHESLDRDLEGMLASSPSGANAVSSRTERRCLWGCRTSAVSYCSKGPTTTDHVCDLRSLSYRGGRFLIHEGKRDTTDTRPCTAARGGNYDNDCPGDYSPTTGAGRRYRTS
jgi:hypothetical protein